jgi:hypothetical protein
MPNCAFGDFGKLGQVAMPRTAMVSILHCLFKCPLFTVLESYVEYTTIYSDTGLPSKPESSKKLLTVWVCGVQGK